MACLEHLCTFCNWSDISNKIFHTCPNCGSRVKTFWDEDTSYEKEPDDLEEYNKNEQDDYRDE